MCRNRKESAAVGGSVALIYLAAGQSRRFGSNKLLYLLSGKPMYLHLLERLCRICERHPGWELILVTGCRELLSEGESLRGVRTADSPCSDKGIAESVKAGVKAAPAAGAYAFFAADQPYLKEETAEAFLMEMEGKRAGLGCVCSNGHRGNPAWFSSAYKEELLCLKGDKGGRQILEAHREQVLLFEVKDERELMDLDVPEAVPER